MFTESHDEAQAVHNNTKSFQLLLVFIAVVFALTIHPAKAHAQITGELAVNIPFKFYAGNAKLPAGNYVLHTLDNSDLRIMEISTSDGSASGLFERLDLQPVRESLLPYKNF